MCFFQSEPKVFFLFWELSYFLSVKSQIQILSWAYCRLIMSLTNTLMYLTSWSTAGDIPTTQLFESLRAHLVLLFMCCSQLCTDWVVLRFVLRVCGHRFLGSYTYIALLLLVIISLESCGLAYKSISRAHLRKSKRLKNIHSWI